MITKIIEVTNGNLNWGKFLLGVFDEKEWGRKVAVKDHPDPDTLLLYAIGHRSDMLWVIDLQTREGAMFKPGGVAKADLEKHQIWVCPMFEPFLEWLYKQDIVHSGVVTLDSLPDAVDLPDAQFRLYGHRRSGAKK
jgi:hypothetical protein